MLALIMAGGEGSRLNLGEKPLVSVGGKPMIAQVIHAFRSYGCEIVVVASAKTPMTQNWCRVNNLDLIPAKGEGFVEDMVAAVEDLDEQNPLFVSVSDLPCLHAGIVAGIHDEYRKSGKEACSTWVPRALIDNHRDVRYVESVNGIDACPVGINILRGGMIHRPQDEFRLLLNEPRLAYNVNTRTDLAYADAFLNNRRP